MYLLYVDNEFISSADVKEMVEQSTEETDIINCFSTATLLKLAEKLSPEIIIIDFELVKDRLSELFSDLREKSNNSHVMALINPDNYEKLYKAIEAGAVDDYIVKPIHKEEFLARVRIAARKNRIGDSRPDLSGSGTSVGGTLLDFDRHKGKPQEEQPETEDLHEDSEDLPDSESEDDYSETTFNVIPEEEKALDQDLGEEPQMEETSEEAPLEEHEFKAEDLLGEKEETEQSYDFDDIMPEESIEPESEDLTESDLKPDAGLESEEEEAGFEMFDDFPEADEQVRDLDQEKEAEKEVQPFEEEPEQFFDEVPVDDQEDDIEALFTDELEESEDPESAGEASLSDRSFESEDDIKDLEDLFEGETKEDTTEEIPEDNLDQPVEEETGFGTEPVEPPAVKPAADFLDDVTLKNTKSEKAATFTEPARPAEEDITDELSFESDIEDEPSFETAGDEELSFEPVSDTGFDTDASELEDDQYFDQLFDEGSEDSSGSSSFDVPEATPAQTEGRKSLREISELPGETADDFLFGESENFDEELEKEKLDELIEEGTFGAKKTKDSRDKGKDKKKGRGIFKFFSILGNVVFVLLLLIMAILSFFLIQSRLAGGVPEIAGYQMYIVLSGSMSPEFDTGSLAFVQDVDPDELAVGDIITYRTQAESDSLTTHRIVEVIKNGNTQFVTRGDANNVNDPNPVLDENIVGRVTGSIPYIGYVLDFVQTRQGLILLIFVPGVLIIMYELGKIMKYLTQGNKEKNKQEKSDSRLAEQ
ncbi:MAG: signal peptidase I [Bacillota bacterium]